MMLHALLLSSPAQAANCDAALARVGNLEPAGVGPAFAEIAACDKGIAEANFKRYLEKASDTDALVELAFAAIAADTWKPLLGALSKVTSYDARDEVARRVGESCATNAKVIPFLELGYVTLRDIDFQQWDDAFAACEEQKLWDWVDKQVRNPPRSMFDEKYNAVVGIYVKRRRAEALPALTEGAVKAAAEGPFDMILMKMAESVAPELGGEIPPDEKTRFEASMVEVASKAGADKARNVASQLANAGADSAAAKLLPTIYADRVQSGGAFLYAAASVEGGTCSGRKQAVIHYAVVTEPGKRWAIQADLETPLRGVKPRLKGCTADEGAWPIVYTPEPMKAGKEADKWAESMQKEWEAKGYEVKLAGEKAFSLP